MPIHGLVKWFDPKKGYGFLVGPDEQDVFVHYSQIRGDGFRTLNDGATVDYDLVHGSKGFQAENVFAQQVETPALASPPPAIAPTLAPAPAAPITQAEAQRLHAQTMAHNDPDA
ncbi:MAG: cold shock domain-containing protein [Algisphaera sp.]